jgi:glycyl-tRNA synthetase
MFVNYKNVLDSLHPKLPFGIAQIGKAFRNEITPRDFTFRTREFNLMEFEYFVKPSEWEKYFEYWKYQMVEWIEQIGIDTYKVHQLEVAPEDRAHYSKRTTDFEFDFPFGRKELYGLACRGDFDLKQHQEHSSVNLEYLDEEAATDSPKRQPTLPRTLTLAGKLSASTAICSKTTSCQGPTCRQTATSFRL